MVLGARVRPDGQPSAALERRMRVAISLYRAGAAPLLVLSGGGGQTVPEAVVMRDLALAAGVPAAALVIEPRSRTTLENASETAKLLAPGGHDAVLLVTDSYHALRARMLFRIAGLTVIAVRTASVPLRPLLGMAAAECVKLPVNLVRALVAKARRAIE
ncbi:MAG TPA: YdcF family protein [Sphingomicrobium sp.]